VRGNVPVKVTPTIAADEGETKPKNTGAATPPKKCEFIATLQYFLSNGAQIAAAKRRKIECFILDRSALQQRHERHPPTRPVLAGTRMSGTLVGRSE
jgi:hypothetical protein